MSSGFWRSSHGGEAKDVTVTLAPPPPSAFRVELDGPKTRDGIAIQPITGRLVVEGWALARDGVAAIDVELDGTLLGQAHFGMAPARCRGGLPDWDGAARSGYTFHCPARALPDGEHVVQVVTRSKTGEQHVHAFRITVSKAEDPEAEASIRRRIRRVERTTTEGVLAQLDWRPAFHLIVAGGLADAAPDDDTSASGDTALESAWALTFLSILEQSWPKWRVTALASGARDAAAARAAIARLAHGNANRFVVCEPSDADTWRAPLASLAPGDTSLIGLLASGDELGRDALGAFAVASGIHRDVDCLYADEFRVAPGGSRPEPFFKPDFSPALLLSENYLGRPLMARPALLAATGMTAEALLRDGFHDLALRCTEAAGRPTMSPELLSRTDGGIAVNRTEDAAAVERAMAKTRDRRRGLRRARCPKRSGCAVPRRSPAKSRSSCRPVRRMAISRPA